MERAKLPRHLQGKLAELNRAIFVRETETVARLYGELLAEVPDYVLRGPVQFDLARLLEQMERHDLALKAYTAIIVNQRDSPSLAPAMKGAGLCAWKLNDFDKAVEHLEAFLATNPLRPDRVEVEEVLSRLPPEVQAKRKKKPAAAGDGISIDEIPSSWSLPESSKPVTFDFKLKKKAPGQSSGMIRRPTDLAAMETEQLGDEPEAISLEGFELPAEPAPKPLRPLQSPVPESRGPRRPDPLRPTAAPPASRAGGPVSTDPTPAPGSFPQHQPPPSGHHPAHPMPHAHPPAPPSGYYPPPPGYYPPPGHGAPPSGYYPPPGAYGPPPAYPAGPIPPGGYPPPPPGWPGYGPPPAWPYPPPGAPPAPAAVPAPPPVPPVAKEEPAPPPTKIRKVFGAKKESPEPPSAPAPGSGAAPTMKKIETAAARYDRLREAEFALVLPVGKRIHLEAVAELVGKHDELDENEARKKVLRRKGILYDGLALSDVLRLHPLVKKCRQSLTFVTVPRHLKPYENFDVLGAEQRDQGLKLTTDSAVRRLRWEDIRLVNCGQVAQDTVLTLLSSEPVKEYRFSSRTFNYHSFSPSGQADFRTGITEMLEVIAAKAPGAVKSHTVENLLNRKTVLPQPFTNDQEFACYTLWILYSRFGEEVNSDELVEMSQVSSNW